MDNFITYCSINEFHNLYRRTTGSISKFSDPCIGYILDGNAEFLYKGKTILATKGDLIYIAPETSYYSLWKGFPDIKLYSITFKLNNIIDYMDYRFQIIHDFPKSLFDNVYKYNNTDFFKTMSNMYALLSAVYSVLQKGSYNSKYEKIAPSIYFIEENYNKNFSVKELSDLCNYSEARFFSLFKEVTEVTPIEYKHNIIIQYALKYLAETQMSVEQISSLLGFSSSNYFRKIFYKHTHITPKEVRKRANQNSR